MSVEVIMDKVIMDIDTAIGTEQLTEMAGTEQLTETAGVIMDTSPSTPSIEEVRSWDAIKLLQWVQKKLAALPLNPENAQKFLSAEINGAAFLLAAGQTDFFNKVVGLPGGPSLQLAQLAKNITDDMSEKNSSVLRTRSKMSINQAFPQGLNYHPPSPRALLATQGRSWQYQSSPKLRQELRDVVYSHHQAYSQGIIDKKTIPLYLFLSGAGTGKSRNASELHILARQCFDGTYFKEDREIADCLTDPYVFHVSLENGTSLEKDEESWSGIGLRMLLQLLPEYKGVNMMISELNELFIPPTPYQVISCLRAAEPVDALKKKALVLVVDGLRMLNFGRNDLNDIVTRLGNFAHGGFYLVCGTSTISGPVSRAMRESQRWRVYLPCEPIGTPRMADGQAVFKHHNLLAQVLIKDCGGHGRALEILAQYMDAIQSNISHVSLFITRLSSIYDSMIPGEGNALAIIKSVMGNGYLARDTILPGGSCTPDEVSARGLIRFHIVNPHAEVLWGKFEIPYIWILCLCCSTYKEHHFFRELQLFDYNQFACMDNPTHPGSSSHDSFEKIILQIRKIKSYMFAEAEPVTIARLHYGGKMTESTAGVNFINHYLTDDIATKQIPTKTTSENVKEWIVQTEKHGDINLRMHNFILLNKPCASAGDAVLCLDSKTPCTEAHQYNKHWANGNGINFQNERDKAASKGDIFVLISTANSIPSLGEEVPDRCVVVLRENWQSYFGPYAARSYLVAKHAEQRTIDQVDP